MVISPHSNYVFNGSILIQQHLRIIIALSKKIKSVIIQAICIHLSFYKSSRAQASQAEASLRAKKKKDGVLSKNRVISSSLISVGSFSEQYESLVLSNLCHISSLPRNWERSKMAIYCSWTHWTRVTSCWGSSLYWQKTIRVWVSSSNKSLSGQSAQWTFFQAFLSSWNI